MAATDQPYRNQGTLDVVFAASCGLLLLTTIWMFAQDYFRDFKAIQRRFRDVEATLAEREMIDKLPERQAVEERRHQLRHARRELDKERAQIAATQRSLKAERDGADEAYRKTKADYDSFLSYYNIAADEASEEPKGTPRRETLNLRRDAIKKDLDTLETQLGSQKDNLDQIDARVKKEVVDRLKAREDKYTEAEESMKRLTGAFDRFAKQAAAKAWGPGDTLRALPIIDGFESPTKIRQIWLNDLTIDYGGFRDVPRYDRCTTCHLGIDRANYDRPALARLGNKDESRRLTGKLESAEKMIQERSESGEKLGYTAADLPGEPAVSTATLRWLGILGVLSALVAGGTLGLLTRSPRVGMLWLGGGVVLTLATTGAAAVFNQRTPAVREIDLKAGEITMYCAHPRLDLFVDSNSPHSMEKFGCTICHAGQGSATDFNLAAHTPTDTAQEKDWKKQHGWKSSHYWDFPMLSRRFVESSCVKCHHQMTDLIRHGTKEEAPKLLKGYNLVKEMGCFGCHEIHGNVRGRSVGPDVRLEPSPALDYLTAADQERARSDAANPPGAMRKVGPSLRRLAEKTDETWTRKWVLNPRGFRDDTRMPHFYDLTNNKEKFLKDNAPEKGAERFPATEIHAIAHYLLAESKGAVGGADTYRRSLQAPLNFTPITFFGKTAHDRLVRRGLSERDMKELGELSKRFSDLALLAAPRQAEAITAAAQRQRQLQERVQELQRKVAATADEKEVKDTRAALAAAAAELETTTETLFRLATPVPLAERIVGDDGATIPLPPKPGDATNGRRLFTEKGCLACHSHEGTRTDQTGKDKDGKDAVLNFSVHSDANFGPELSRIADKVRPAVKGVDARRWVVQWLLNPNVYHPRTRMPITHLTPEQANDIAAWLLQQPEQPWDGKDPALPAMADLVALARVYLIKAPGMTRADVDRFLSGDQPKGIPADRLTGRARDSEERRLEEGRVNRDSLLWYIGKKAVGRLGCYGCHDIPGFENAKPIGTGLNDWGKKDPERLAFEDGEAFVRSHFNIVPNRGSSRRVVEERILALWTKAGNAIPAEDKDKENFAKWLATAAGNVSRAVTQPTETALVAAAEARLDSAEQAELARLKRQIEAQKEILDLEKQALRTGLSGAEQRRLAELRPLKFFEADGDLRPFETIFAEALGHGHRSREGFLHLKLFMPRSYDYNRLVKWDDRLRMPQFQFARTRRRANETEAAYQARKEVEEAEAREAVMTFILGLVAEPVPLKYVYQPKGERAAEVTGQQVLDKYNCAACHQVRPGVYEFKLTDRILSLLQREQGKFQDTDAVTDHIFRMHNAWVGTTPTSDRLTAFGYPNAVMTQQVNDDPTGADYGTDVIRLTNALRFPGLDRVMRDLPAGNHIYLPKGSYTAALPSGGTWADLMVPYLARQNAQLFPANEPHKARASLPPTLVRQGERVQPEWLYRFLLNPTEVRPQPRTGAPLNPGQVILRMPKFNMSPDESRALVNYFAAVARMSNPGAGVTFPYLQLPQRQPDFWRHVGTEYPLAVSPQVADALIAHANKDREKAQADLKTEKDEAKIQGLKGRIAQQEEAVKNVKAYLALKGGPADKAADRVANQAFALMRDKTLCVSCHNIGTIRSENPQGPNLALAADRLRPEWMEQWIANPKRLFTYEPLMPQNFPNSPNPEAWVHQNHFVGTPLMQTRAVRDVLMDPHRLAELLAKQPPTPVPKDKAGENK